MSLIDVILGQKIIPLTIGLALLLIMLAVVLMIVPRIRKHRAKAAQLRAERMAAAAVMAEQIDDEPEPIQARTTPKKPAALTPAASVQPAAKPAAAAVLTATPAQPAGQPGESAPSAMQDILSSVFSDEDNSERQAALMRGMSDVDMNDLLTLTQQVVVQLHGGKTVTVVNEKELQ